MIIVLCGLLAYEKFTDAIDAAFTVGVEVGFQQGFRQGHKEGQDLTPKPWKTLAPGLEID